MTTPSTQLDAETRMLADIDADSVIGESRTRADRRHNHDKTRQNRLARRAIHNTLKAWRGPTGLLLAAVAISAAGAVFAGDKGGSSRPSAVESIESKQKANDTLNNQFNFSAPNRLAGRE
jgi:hypothetical protein